MWLEAPLQSWGCDSKFGRRETLNFPTKSGVIGLLLCAMGKGGAQRELLKRLCRLSLSVAAFPKKLKGKGKSEKLTSLCDFQMVGSGYDKKNNKKDKKDNKNNKDNWQNLMIPKTEEGKNPQNASGVILTYRYYLQDMAFAVLLELPEDQELSSELENSLQTPVWTLCLGRKNCVPTERIYQGTYETREQAFKHAGELAEQKNRICSFIVKDGFYDDFGDDPNLQDANLIMNYVINDVPVQFGTVKEYTDRQVSIYYKGV